MAVALGAKYEDSASWGLNVDTRTVEPEGSSDMREKVLITVDSFTRSPNRACFVSPVQFESFFCNRGPTFWEPLFPGLIRGEMYMSPDSPRKEHPPQSLYDLELETVWC